MIFLGSEEELNNLFEFMNALHPTIKFTFEFSHSSIAFLDLQIYINSKRGIETTLYRKPTDCMCLLHFSSHHSLSCKESVIYSQALRYISIISEHENLQKELDNLARTLLARNYPIKMIHDCFEKAIHKHRNLNPRNQDTLNGSGSPPQKKITPFVVPYSTIGKDLAKVVKQNWPLIENEPDLKQIWPNPPLTAYKRTSSLKDILVHSAHEP